LETANKRKNCRCENENSQTAKEIQTRHSPEGPQAEEKPEGRRDWQDRASLPATLNRRMTKRPETKKNPKGGLLERKSGGK